MLSSIDIHNFQSLKDVHLDLGLLTVIVGNSNCGKSATVRAIQALASNIRGSSCITMGFKTASVSAVADTYKVTLEKSDTSSSYRITQSGQTDREFTKLAGDVPEEVTSIIGISPVRDGSSINFAGQHDSPFLLTTPGAQVARTLGELTSVITIFEAVRKANRRRTVANSDLRLRNKDLDEISDKLTSIETLKIRTAALKEANALLKKVQLLETEVEDLKVLKDRLEELGNIKGILPEVSIDSLLIAYDDLKTFKAIALSIKSAYARRHKYSNECNEYLSAETSAGIDLQQVLEELGECPTCGSQIEY
jgi:DNA repair ATPase RecN